MAQAAALEEPVDDTVFQALRRLNVLPAGASEDLARDYARVLSLLVARSSMPYLEIRALSGVDYKGLHTIVEALEKHKLVRIADRGNIDEIVTLNSNRLPFTSYAAVR